MTDQVKSKMDAEDEIMVAVNNKVEDWKVTLSSIHQFCNAGRVSLWERTFPRASGLRERTLSEHVRLWERTSLGYGYMEM